MPLSLGAPRAPNASLVGTLLTHPAARCVHRHQDKVEPHAPWVRTCGGSRSSWSPALQGAKWGSEWGVLPSLLNALQLAGRRSQAALRRHAVRRACARTGGEQTHRCGRAQTCGPSCASRPCMSARRRHPRPRRTRPRSWPQGRLLTWARGRGSTEAGRGRLSQFVCALLAPRGSVCAPHGRWQGPPMASPTTLNPPPPPPPPPLHH